MEAKLKALKEVEQIYRLSKKWRRNLPDEKRPDFERMADRVFRQAMEAPARSNHQRVNVRAGKHMHEHDSRSARLIERTLRSGEFGPDALHSYQAGVVQRGRRRVRYPQQKPQPQDFAARHVVQHTDRDLVYPHGHMQGKGFVPSLGEAQVPHKLLKAGPGASAPTELPTTDSIKTTYV